ncbi:MAG: hypothetical protein NUK54_10870, partial [Methanothrix sp.]|nr:hypothetical protein [Methanothrix sp.]
MIEVDTTPSPEYDEIRAAELNLHDIFADIFNRGNTATIILTQDVASSRIKLLLAQYTVLSNFEFAISGKHSDDQLSTLPLAEQEALITRSIAVAKAARVCGLSEVEVLGFMPPGFDQNEDTYEVIDNLGIGYDAGFQAGLIYAPGHEEDVWPYQVEGHNFSAVPVSTAEVDGKLLPLHDKSMAEEGISAAQWAEILKTKLDEAAAANEPVVILISTSLSGAGEYRNALNSFLDYAGSMNASFVNVGDLVTMAKTGSLAPPEAEESECLACGDDEIKVIEIRYVEPPAPEPAEAVDEETPET